LTVVTFTLIAYLFKLHAHTYLILFIDTFYLYQALVMSVLLYSAETWTLLNVTTVNRAWYRYSLPVLTEWSKKSDNPVLILR